MDLRPLTANESDFLQDMMYAAIHVPEGQSPLSRAILEEPEIRRYWSQFGSRRGDIALVAEIDGVRVGLVWTRLFTATAKGYSFVDEATPELCMAVRALYRGRGIGTRLLTAIEKACRAHGFAALSLSVDRTNRVRNLYARAGYVVVAAHGSALTMVKRLWAESDP